MRQARLEFCLADGVVLLALSSLLTASSHSQRETVYYSTPAQLEALLACLSTEEEPELIANFEVVLWLLLTFNDGRFLVVS